METRQPPITCQENALLTIHGKRVDSAHSGVRGWSEVLIHCTICVQTNHAGARIAIHRLKLAAEQKLTVRLLLQIVDHKELVWVGGKLSAVEGWIEVTVGV